MKAVALGHGRGWLDAPAAASVKRIDYLIGRPLDINSAGRTRAAWDAWQNGTGAPANLPGTSMHEKGLALDTDDRFLAVMSRNGWWRPYSHEPWHFEYLEQNDKMKELEMLTDKDVDRIATAVWAKVVGVKDSTKYDHGPAGRMLANAANRAGKAATYSKQAITPATDEK
jgi:hypothetical protein